jgi:hypothetical protein
MLGEQNAKSTPIPAFPHLQKSKMGEGVAGKAQIMGETGYFTVGDI